jgi:O-antigen/teichoic acid export membrane protein
MSPARPSEAAPAGEPTVESTKAAKRHIRGSALLLLGRFVSLGIGLATQVLTVRYLSKQDYGAFAFAISMVSFGSSLAVCGLDKTMARFMPFYDEGREYSKMWGALVLLVVTILSVGAVFVLGVIACQGLIGESLVSGPLSLTLLLTLLALAPIQALDSALVALLSVFVGARAIFFRRYLLAPGLQLAAVLLVIATQGSAQWLAVGYLVGGALGVGVYAMVLVNVFRRRGLWAEFRSRPLQLPAKEIYGFSFPMLLSDMGFLVRAPLITVLLEALCHSEAVAQFRAVLPVARLNEVVLRSFTFLFIPITARMLARQRHDEINDVYWKSVLWITVFSFPLFAVSFALAEPVTVALFEARYAESAGVLAVLALGYFFHAAAGLNSRTLKVYGRVKTVLAIDIGSTLFAIPLNLWLIPRYGAIGGAIGLTATLVLQNVLNEIALHFATGISVFKWRYGRLYLLVAAVAAGLWGVQWLWSPPLAAGLALAALASLLVVMLNRQLLDVQATFPELLRVPLIGRWFGSGQREESRRHYEE